jgi:two-component system sensor kinase FixL
MGVVLDITDRKQAEERLRESEQRFRAMADAAPVMIWMSGTDKLCIFFNKGWLDFTGRTLAQEFGNGWSDGVHEEDFHRCLEVYTTAFDARQEFTMEYRLRRHDGEYRWVLDHGVPRSGRDGAFLGYIGTTIDITERQRSAETLERERKFLKQVIDIAPNFIFAKDQEGRFTLANKAVAGAYGTTVENLIGKTDADFNPNREEVEFFRRMDLEVIDTLQERFIPDERITDAQGKVHWMQTVKRPIVAADGSGTQVLGASTDITLRKEAELELQEERAELAHVARISTMGELAASLAHELNQPLTAILSNAQAALRFMSNKPANVEEVREILHDIVQDNSRAGEVIRRMRVLVKKEALEFASLDLATLIRDVGVLLHSDAILHNVKITLELDDDLPAVRGDKVQLQQVVLNLMLNAFDAMKDSAARERIVKLRLEGNGGGLIQTSVRDRGTGLSGDKLDKIFQPFYTTKGEGLGMGLSICRSIIEAHGGRLWAENNPDRGASFYFTVPVAEEAEGPKYSIEPKEVPALFK